MGMLWVSNRQEKCECVDVHTSTPPYLCHLLQAYLEFRHLGMGHLLWVTNRKEKCERADAIFPGEIGCGWAHLKGLIVPNK